MNISRVRVASLACGDAPSRACLVRLETDQGLRGLGVGPKEALGAVQVLAEQVLYGEDPRAVVTLCRRLADRAARDGDATPPCAAAVLDMALWDLKARINQEPLWRSLGGRAPRVRVHLAVDSDAVELPGGAQAFLLQAGRDSDEDAARMQKIVEAAGSAAQRTEWYLDLGDRFTISEALEYVQTLEATFDVTCVMASARAWEDADFRGLSSSILAAVCNSEDPAGEWFAPRLDTFALDMVRVDPARRGITGALQLSDAAYGYELPVLLCPMTGDVGAHLAPAMPSFAGLATGPAAALPEGMTSSVRLEDGHAVAGEEPGLGLGFGSGIEEQVFGGAA